MACLLYCVTLANVEPVSNLTGVADQPIRSHDSGGLRLYWSEVANAEGLVEGASRKPAELKYQQVLREMAMRATAIGLAFPTVIGDVDSVDALVSARQHYYVEALERLSGTIQYELTATWAEADQVDLATPISGKEYVKRRAESEARIAAIDTKLKTVTAGIVREWRSRQERRKHLWFALMPREDRERFIAALRSAGPSEGVGLRLRGPLLPTEFVQGSQ